MPSSQNQIEFKDDPALSGESIQTNGTAYGLSSLYRFGWEVGDGDSLT